MSLQCNVSKHAQSQRKWSSFKVRSTGGWLLSLPATNLGWNGLPQSNPLAYLSNTVRNTKCFPNTAQTQLVRNGWTNVSWSNGSNNQPKSTFHIQFATAILHCVLAWNYLWPGRCLKIRSSLFNSFKVNLVETQIVKWATKSDI